MQSHKKIPYALTNFERIRTEGYIEHIERENNPDLFFDNSKIISTLETDIEN